jgi:Uma2 family endonuclease
VSTITEVQYALRRLTLDERQVIASWLEGYQEQETGAIGVAEPAARYAVEWPYMTLEEFFEFEERSATPHEFVNGVVHAMSGPSMAHCRIVQALVSALEKRLQGGRCEVFSQQMELNLKIDSDEFVYHPDVMVACDPTGWTQRWIRNPRLVIEVLSPSTQHIDRREKAITYRRTSTVEEYVIAAQSSRQLTIYRRAENWAPEVVSGLEGVVELCSLDVSIPLAEIYCKVFPEPASPDRAGPE